MERREKIRGFLITENEVRVAEFVPSLENYYKMLDCTLIDIATRKIGAHYYDIICDDEGLLKENFRVTALNSNKEVMLVGNLLIVNHDNEGNEAGLTDKDIEEIEGKTFKIKQTLENGKRVSSWAIECEY